MDEVVSEPGEQFGSIVVPGQAEGCGALASLGLLLFLGQGQVSVRLVIVTHQVPDGDTVVGGNAHPLQFLVEEDLVDLALRINGSDGLLEVGDVPEVEGLVLASGGQVLGVGGDGHGVDLSLVGLEGVSNLEIGVPDLESSVPSDRGEVGVEGALGLALQVGRVSDLADPVLMVVLLRGVSAVGQGVPEFDLLVGTR